MEQLIQWCIANAFNVEGQDGTKYIAIDYEDMKEKFPNLLETEKKQIVEAFDAGVNSAAHRINGGDMNVRRGTMGEFIELWTDFDKREYFNNKFKK